MDEHFYKAALGRDIRAAIMPRAHEGRDAVKAWLGVTEEEWSALRTCNEFFLSLHRLRVVWERAQSS
jgi:hypothetical protein